MAISLRRSKGLRIVLFLFLTLLSACSISEAQVISSGERYAAPTMVNDEYRLGIGDKLRVIVFNEEALSGEFQVNSGGNISLPLVGEVRALGETTDSVGKATEAKLADGYLRDPKVSIEVLTFRPFFILGEVKNPGQYPFANGLTALNAIASAQGFTPRADEKVVWIRNAGAAQEQLYRLTPDLRIRPGDTIRIGERLF
jgi:polysaccharide export outer membrane protein